MSEMPQALAYERVKIDSLQFDPRNARKHDDRNIKAIMDSLSKFGQQKAIVVGDGGVVIAGNGTLEAAKRLGWDTIDIRRSGLMSDEATAYAIADNRSAELAEWDDPVLGDILSELKESGWELDDLGFNDEDLEKYIKQEGTDGLTDEDDVPEVAQNEFGVKRWDIWQLGDHRLMCGDSTDNSAVENLMNGEKADMVFTSPPYNGDTHLDYGKGKNKKLYNSDFDNKTSKDYLEFLEKALALCFECCTGFIFWNINYNAKSRFEFIESIFPFRGKLHETIVWKKQGMPISHGLTRCFEFVFVFKNGVRSHLSHENKTEFNLWDISNINSQDKENHRACFPVALPEKGILIGSEPSQIILEPFCGSGSTLIACEKTGRKCYGMELDEHYCSVIIKRWQDFTGKKAERIVEGA
jgi:DNA modification methylase